MWIFQRILRPFMRKSNDVQNDYLAINVTVIKHSKRYETDTFNTIPSNGADNFGTCSAIEIK